MTLAIACLAGGCRQPSKSASAPTTLRIGVGVGGTARSGGLSVLTDFLYAEPLIALGWDGKAHPALAESWQWEDEGRTLRLRLQPSIVMHDGRPLVASLVANYLRPGLAKSGVLEILAPDTRTLLLRLAEPDAFLIAELSALNIRDAEAADVGTGPFRLVSRKPRVEALRFDQYRGGLPAIAAVELISYDTPRAAWAALMRGDVDALQDVSRDSIEFLEASRNVNTYTSVQPFYVPLVFNLREGALANVEVRRAISAGINREAIIKKAMNGFGRVAATPVWPLHWAYDTRYASAPYEPQAARARLDAAGFPMRTVGGKQSRFSFECVFYSEDAQYERIALMVQRDLYDIGVDMQIAPMTLKELTARAAAGQFEAYLAPMYSGRDLNYVYRFWRSRHAGEHPLQDSGYTGADGLLDTVRKDYGAAQTAVAVAELQRRFIEDAPAAFLAWNQVTRAVDARFTVGEVEAQDVFSQIWLWRPATSEGRSR
jgi:ABC-type transport system substrate-binding protein